jgi:hypothetical protein
MPPEPSIVWMVHSSTGQRGVRGQLILEPDRLIFRPELTGAKLDQLGETVLAGADIRHVGRSRHSPVLELRVTAPGVPDVVFFYFVKPPDMYSSGLPNPRTAVATYLTSSNAVYSDEVDEWHRAIREGPAASGK